MGIGPWEIAGIVVIVLVIFGAGRLAGVGKALGQGVREFREEARNPSGEEDEQELAESDEQDADDESVASSGSSAGREVRTRESEAGRKADGQDGA